MSGPAATPRAVILLAAGGHVLVMSLTHVLGRIVLAREGVPASVTVALRAAVAAGVLLASYAVWRPRPRGGPLNRGEWLLLAVIMALAVPLNQFFYILGLKFAPAVHSALLFCTTPLVISLLDAAFGGRRARTATFAGATLALAGVVLVFEEGLEFGASWLKGDLILGVSVLAWSVLTLISRPLLARVPKFALTRITLLGGSVMLVPLVAHDLAAFDYGSLSARSAWCIVFLGVFTSVLSYLNWYFLLSRIGAVRSGMLLTLQPITTALLASAMLGEPLTAQLAAGGTIVLAGLMLVHLTEARAERAARGSQTGDGSSSGAHAPTAQRSAAVTKK